MIIEVILLPHGPLYGAQAGVVIFNHIQKRTCAVLSEGHDDIGSFGRHKRHPILPGLTIFQILKTEPSCTHIPLTIFKKDLMEVNHICQRLHKLSFIVHKGPARVGNGKMAGRE